METFPALLALCEGNSPVTGEFPSQRPMTQSFGVFVFFICACKPSKRRWFETPPRSLWRHCNVHIGHISSSFWQLLILLSDIRKISGERRVIPFIRNPVCHKQIIQNPSPAQIYPNLFPNYTHFTCPVIFKLTRSGFCVLYKISNWSDNLEGDFSKDVFDICFNIRRFLDRSAIFQWPQDIWDVFLRYSNIDLRKLAHQR